MPQHVTESIWHFIGYMHLEELLSRTPIHYSGANAYDLQPIDNSRIVPLGDEQIDPFDGRSPTRAFEVKLPPVPPVVFADPFDASGARPSPLRSIETEPVPVPLPMSPALDVSIVPGETGPTRSPDVGTDGASPAIELVSAAYEVGESQLDDFHITQANSLIDADVMRADPSVLVAAGLDAAMPGDSSDASAELAQLVQQAIDALPSGILPAPPATGIEHTKVTQDDEPKVELPVEGDVVAEEVAAGRYVDGERVGDGGTSTAVIHETAAEVGEAVEAAAPVDRSVVETVTSPDGNLHIVTGSTPTGGIAHDAITGENNLVNAAVLYDLSHAASSIIVRGDVRETNAIVQINALQDKDAIGSLGGTLLQTAVAGNDTTNEATFVEEAGPIYGNVMLGGVPGALSWQIDYVQGDFYDLTTLQQVNFLVDTDISEQTTTSTHFVATLGDNGAINLAQLDVAMTYDLIIIGGNYNEINAIIQVNALLDDDVVHQLSHGPAAEQSVDGGGNALGNDAAIVSIGGESYKPLAGDPAQLAEAIGRMEAQFDPALAAGLPWNGADTLKVLYVTGDYYDYNVLYQTNVLDDSDHVTQVAPTDDPPAAGGEAGEDEDASTLTQTAVAGGNTLDNLALIVSVGSTSDYQYVGGAVYEDTLLVQANIVTESSEDAEADLHPDVVATIAALSGSAAETPSCTDDTSAHTDTSNTVDVIGGILA